MSNYKYYTDGPEGEMRFREENRFEPIYISPEDVPGWQEYLGLALFMSIVIGLIVWMVLL